MELFRIDGLKLHGLERSTFKLEREVQRLLEANLEAVFGVTFVDSEYSTGDKHGGRIDTLGIDENGTPVIFEYKRTGDPGIITQALFYLNWLLDHHGDFEMLVQKRLGSNVTVDWTSPRVVCVAESFAKYDADAVASMGANIELATYRLFAGQLLGIDVLGAPAGARKPTPKPQPPKGPKTVHTIEEHLAKAMEPMREIADELLEYISGLGDDISVNPVQEYIAFRTTRNFCCLETHNKHIFLYLSLDPALGAGCTFCRNVSNIGHFGTGDLEVRVEQADQVEEAKNLAQLAYATSTGAS